MLEIVGRRRTAVLSEIGGTCTDDAAHRSNAGGGQRTIREITDPQGNIHLVIYEMGDAVGEHQSYVDFRVGAQKVSSPPVQAMQPTEHRRSCHRKRLLWSAVYSPEAVRSASFSCSRMALAAVINEWPAGVGISPFADRVKSVVFRWASNSETLRLTVARGR